MKGSSIGDEPVARMTFSVEMCATLLPSESVTLQVFPSTNEAHPFTSRTPAPLSSASTPLFSFSTMSSFQPISAGMSTATSPVTESPMCPSWCSRSASKRSAAWMIAFEGMQPRIKQVPPALSPSTMTVSRPSWPALIAAT